MLQLAVLAFNGLSLTTKLIAIGSVLAAITLSIGVLYAKVESSGHDRALREVAAGNYPRPAPRPAAWDVATSSTAPVARPAPTKRPGFLKRTVQKTSMLFHRKPKPSAGSIEPLPKEEPPSRSAAGKLPFDALPWGMKIESPPPIPPAASPPQPEPPPKPRSPVDELLDGPKKPPANSPK
jgi:hypothetical protein